MKYQGHVENGIIVTEHPLPLPDGTPVRVEPLGASADFWPSASLEELATEQGVAAPNSVDELMGGWPTEDLHDNFEGAVARWREHDSEPGQ